MEQKQWNIGYGVQIACALYLLIPLAIFFMGWLRWYYAIPLLAILIFCFWRMLSGLPKLTLPALDRSAWIKLGVALIIIAAITVFSGVGGVVYQTVDHRYRNQIFKILVDYPWPPVQNGSALVYYIGFWMPAALIGKLFGLLAGFHFQMVWMALGLILLFLLLCLWRKKIVLWPLVIFLFFSGLDILASAYMQLLFPEFEMFHLFEYGISLDHWPVNMMYPSLLTNLFWSFQQAAPVYVLILLLLLQPDCRNYAFFAAPCLLCGTLPVVALVPIALTLACSKPVADDPIDRRWLVGKGAWLDILKAAFSLQNILGGAGIALPLWFYLSANRSGMQIGFQEGFSSSSTFGVVPIIFLIYLIALLTEFGIYMLLIIWKQQKNALLAVLAVLLIICPLIMIGNGSDFCMRTSMAALPFLALIIMDTLVKYKAEGNKLMTTLLICALALGALTPLSEIGRTAYQTFITKHTMQPFVVEEMIFEGDNFSGDAQGNVFFDVLARE